MRKKPVLAGFLVFLSCAGRSDAAPVSKAQLLSMAQEKVDPKVILAIVERDCIDFEVDAGNVSELSRLLPPEVLQAAIACRKTPAPTVSESRNPEPKNPEAKPVAGTLRLRAEFIGESAALSCSCRIDGEPLATLTKPEQGEFGKAVERTKIRKQSADLPVPAGKHRLIFRCDPKAQEISAEVEIAPGKLRTVEIRETTLRHWKLRRIE